MDREKIIKDFISFGLSKREAKVYYTLFLKKELSAAEIQKHVSILRTKVYEILLQLMNKGFCAERKIGRLKKYYATDPYQAFQNQINNLDGILKTKKNIVSEILNHIAPIYEKNTSDVNPLEFIEILYERKRICERYIHLQQTAQKEIMIFTKKPYALPEKDNVKNAFNVLQRDVTLETIYEIEDFENTEFEKEMIEKFAYSGGKTRFISELPMKLAIFDEKITMLALKDPVSLKPLITTIIINHPDYARAQKEIFKAYWKRSFSLEELIEKYSNSRKIKEK
ncbi:MAG TPA: TrmB family transcriptional regulator [Candidatus Cloacimonetes bacterium]|nr:TrmB family transcriptional regulator [Candidatus Cloacimonadota bacterium]